MVLADSFATPLAEKQVAAFPRLSCVPKEAASSVGNAKAMLHQKPKEGDLEESPKVGTAPAPGRWYWYLPRLTGRDTDD